MSQTIFASPIQQTRVVLRPEIAQQQVENFAWDADWLFHGVEQATETTPYQIIWTAEEGDVTVFLH